MVVRENPRPRRWIGMCVLALATSAICVDAFLPPNSLNMKHMHRRDGLGKRKADTRLGGWGSWRRNSNGDGGSEHEPGSEGEELEVGMALSPDPSRALAATTSSVGDDTFDGFEGFYGKRVSYSSQPKARNNIIFEIWRQRTMDDIAILYKGTHQYSASKRVQDAINEQVSSLLGMFLREPDFQSRMEIQGGELANLFFKLQLLGYMFCNADRLLSASSSLNVREPPRQPLVGNLSGNVTIQYTAGKEVTLGAKEMFGNLAQEVEALRAKLAQAKMNREVARQGDLIAFIRSLPEDQQRSMTECMPDYTLDCMRKLVDLTLARAIPTVGNQWNPMTPVLIPSKSVFAELCIMQMVQGYLLRATEEDQLQQVKMFGGPFG